MGKSWVSASLLALGVMAVGKLGHAQELQKQAMGREHPRLLQRFAVDWGYSLSYGTRELFFDAYQRDHASGRQMSAQALVRHTTAEQGLYLDLSFALRPWFSLGLEGDLREQFRAPSGLWIDRMRQLGIQIGTAQVAGLGPFVEFRPRSRSYYSRSSWFLRVGLKLAWERLAVEHPKEIETSLDHRSSPTGLLWTAAGYRINLGRRVTVHGMLDAGFLYPVYAGFRFGGGFK